MKTFASFLAASALVFSLASCGGDAGPKPDVEITKTTMSGDMAKTVAHIQVEGIHCVEGCGGKINAELGKIACVSNSGLVDFSEENPVNLIEVEFDPSACNEQEMIAAINSASDGKFTVKAMEVITYEQ